MGSLNLCCTMWWNVKSYLRRDGLGHRNNVLLEVWENQYVHVFISSGLRNFKSAYLRSNLRHFQVLRIPKDDKYNYFKTKYRDYTIIKCDTDTELILNYS